MKSNRKNILNLQNKTCFAKQIVSIFILLISSFLGYLQNGMGRKQLFGYDWKFFLGDEDVNKSDKLVTYTGKKLTVKL